MLKDFFEIIKNLVKYEENYIKKNEDRLNFILEFLEKNKIDYFIFEHFNLVPEWKKYYLLVDGEEVKVLPTGLKSGKIEEKNLKDSSDLENEYKYPNINFNSRLESEKDISTPIFYNVPSLAVSKKTAKKIIDAKEVYGEIKVKIRDKKTKNILIGNLENPEKITVIHYDALWYGAIDNSASVAVILILLKNKKIDLKKNLIFLVGDTEVTYYWPEYWDYSFRRIKEKYEDLFEKAKKVIIIDCIGYKNTRILDEDVYLEAYGIFGEEEKLVIFGTPLEDLMGIYHATNDTLDKISEEQISKDMKTIEKLLK